MPGTQCYESVHLCAFVCFCKAKYFEKQSRLYIVQKFSGCEKDDFMVSERFFWFFFFSPTLLDGERRTLWYSQTAKHSICIQKSRYRKTYYNITQYHLDTEWEVRLWELPDSSKYVIKLQRKSKCTLKCPFGVLCQYFIFQRTQPIFQKFH